MNIEANQQGETGILNNRTPEKQQLVSLLRSEGDEMNHLLNTAHAIRLKETGNKVYLRGLVEFSNVCSKDCYYCGIRKSNRKVNRYSLSDEEILSAARFALENNYGSFVMQSGERSSPAFTARMERLLKEIRSLSEGRLGITLSVGEQDHDTYSRWFDAGAHRYLLRIETSSGPLYRKLHPSDGLHSFENRVSCLEDLKAIGYQVGTGVMIGLPFQDAEDLADDLLFMQQIDVDMAGMGPYLEHPETPLYSLRHELLPVKDRFYLSLKMIAVLRILMRDINIAATTALQAIDPVGREKAIRAGANILMPNITPGLYRNEYDLYEHKPCITEEPGDCSQCMDVRVQLASGEIGYGEWGDSRHFFKRNRENPQQR